MIKLGNAVSPEFQQSFFYHPHINLRLRAVLGLIDLRLSGGGRLQRITGSESIAFVFVLCTFDWRRGGRGCERRLTTVTL